MDYLFLFLEGGTLFMAQVNHVLNMILDHQLSRDWRGTCERCVPGRKLLHPEEADVESAGEREDAADTTG